MARVKKYCNLSEELLIEIFYWLPVVSLLKLRYVCKSWLAIISDPKFIKTHSHHGKITSNKVSLLMVTNWQSCSRHQSFAEFNYHIIEPRRYIVLGSCNGIICLEVDNFFHLWNPTIKQGKRLPIFPKIEEDLTHARPSVELAFGLDTISDDYKIIKFISPTISTDVAPVVQLYSTNTGSLKEIYVHDTSVSEVLCNKHLQLGPIIKGALYMCRKERLVSFNLDSEMFSVVEFPSSMLRYSAVLDFEESVAVISGSVGEESVFSLWTLDDISGELSWTKKFIFRNDIGWVYSYLGGGLFYGRMPDVSTRHSFKSPKQIMYACSIKKSFKIPVLKYSSTVLKYRETLVSIEGFEPVLNGVVPWFNPSV